MTDTTIQNNNSQNASKVVEKAEQLKIVAGKKHTIDATNKKIGRLATEIAVLLMGKNTASFAKNEVVDIEVEVVNASKMAITHKKKEETKHARYSGYPGGLRMESMKNIIEKKGYREVLKEAVYGMLPINKLRTKRIKLLTISE